LSNSSSPTVSWNASEAASFQCSVDAGRWSSCSSPDAIGPLADGSHTFAVQATDTAGNQSIAVAAWTIDTTPPTITLSAQPAALSNSSSPTLSWNASEASTFQCSVDSGPWSSCSSPDKIGPLADGSHTFAARATDTAGNVQATP